MPSHAMLCCAVLHRAALRCAVLCRRCSVLCCAVLLTVNVAILAMLRLTALQCTVLRSAVC